MRRPDLGSRETQDFHVLVVVISGCEVCVRGLDWTNGVLEYGPLLEEEQPQVLLAADVVYDPDVIPDLLQVVHSVIEPPTTTRQPGQWIGKGPGHHLIFFLSAGLTSISGVYLGSSSGTCHHRLHPP